jgi:hypothetical protein
MQQKDGVDDNDLCQTRKSLCFSDNKASNLTRIVLFSHRNEQSFMSVAG